MHTCCAPCSAYVYDILKKNYQVSLFFYNPNIYPPAEYQKRLSELKTFTSLKKIDLIIGQYNSDTWENKIKPYKHLGEKSKRCWECYQIRLEETFKEAALKNFDLVTTTLSISPHKNAPVINQIGKKLERDFPLLFLEADFKKNDGYKKSLDLSRKNNFYRQNYCGCRYSLKERIALNGRAQSDKTN